MLELFYLGIQAFENMIANTHSLAHDPRHDDSEFEYAGFWIRFAAYVVDSLICMVVLAPYWFYTYGQMMDMSVDQIQPYTAWDLIVSLVMLAIFIWFWVKKGATPGKMLFGLQIRDAKTGQFISVPKALLRYLIGYTISGLVFGLGFIWIAFDKKKQGWHDKIASTVVVKRIR